MPWLMVGGALVAAFAGLAVRYAAQRARIEASWLRQVEPRLSSIGEVDQLTIVPLVERLVTSSQLTGELGLSYLLDTGQTRLLFDSGLNARGRARSALVANAEALGVDLQQLDGIVISHRHLDHVGGLRNQLRGTFSLAAEPLEPKGLPAYVPGPMTHERADLVLTTGPRVIAPGIAVLPPLPAMMFWAGSLAEQALVVNVRGFGLVLISGCGHPGIERMLTVAEQVLDVPITGVIGGLHLPVHALGTPLLFAATFGNPNWPWRPVSESNVAAVLEALDARGPRLVALSGHDSTAWTYDAFARALGERYVTMRVGEHLRFAAEGATVM